MAKIDTSNFRDKASKNPDELRLYEDHDYITAYGLHTDLRIERDGYEAAIGSNDKTGQEWDQHGRSQFGFLKHCGLVPGLTLLDFGCGTGRLARHAVPYLDAGNYVGVDISAKAIEKAEQLGKDEGWAGKDPLFILGDGSLKPVKDHIFDIIWAHSVITHTPWEIAETLFQRLSEMTFGDFYFTYKQAERYQRSGLKQFQYHPNELIDLANSVGLNARPIDLMWPAGQKTMHVY